MIAEPRKGGTEPGLSAGFPIFFSCLAIGVTCICEGRNSIRYRLMPCQSRPPASCPEEPFRFFATWSAMQRLLPLDWTARQASPGHNPTVTDYEQRTFKGLLHSVSCRRAESHYSAGVAICFTRQ